MAPYIKLKIRWKFYLVLLCFSLTPLVLVTLINQHNTQKLGHTLSHNTHTELTRIISQSLVQTTNNHAKVLLRSKQCLEAALLVVANDAERALANPTPSSPPPLFSAKDYDAGINLPPDYGPVSNYRKHTANGQTQPVSVSFDHPVYFFASGADRYQSRDQTARLSRLVPAFKALTKEYKGMLYWVYVSLESGVHMSYPGHGGYPPSYEPRTRPWYKRAVAGNYESSGGRLTWTLPIVDASSRQVVFTASVKILFPDGRLAGVAALDVLITEVLQENDMRALKSSDLRSFYVLSPGTGHGPHDKLAIMAQRAYQQKATSWKGTIKTEFLESTTDSPYQKMLTDLKQGQSGVVTMPYKDVESIWAYADVDSHSHFVLIIPKTAAMQLPEKNRRAILDFTNRHLFINALAAVLLIMVVSIAVLYGSRATTRTILKIAGAARRLSRGDFSARINLRTGDERDQVIDAINRMGPRLQDHLRIRHALDLAQEVQQNLLPRANPEIFGLDIAGSSIYCDETGGDYYDFFKVGAPEQNRLAVIVGDVSGHGISSALLMATARALLRQRASMPGETTQILSDVNRQLSFDTVHTNQFMTLFYSEFDPQARVIHWIRAGHDPAMVYDQATDTFEALKGKGMALGLDETFQFTKCSRNLTSGEIILIGTDGIWEMHDSKGQMFGKAKLREVIRRHAGKTAAEIQAAIIRALNTFKGDRPPEDDVTMVIVKVL